MTVPAAPAASVNFIDKILAGGFLKGYRTYVIGIVAVIGFLVPWFTGDASLMQVLSAHWQDILIALGLYTAAAH